MNYPHFKVIKGFNAIFVLCQAINTIFQKLKKSGKNIG
jgi:hypothetical protein